MPAVQTALVIGDGIAGPVAATALAMAGIDTAIYEARPADPASANGIGGSLALEPNGLAALRTSKPGREMPTPHGLPPRQLTTGRCRFGR
jgi:2-polyprenyl-6-methoxyphenol hydroxylase-like FAD-dependent oxidoreductase